MLRYDTQKTWFSRLVRHPARKRSGSILTTPEPARGENIKGCGRSQFQFLDLPVQDTDLFEPPAYVICSNIDFSQSQIAHSIRQIHHEMRQKAHLG